MNVGFGHVVPDDYLDGVALLVGVDAGYPVDVLQRVSDVMRFGYPVETQPQAANDHPCPNDPRPRRSAVRTGRFLLESGGDGPIMPEFDRLSEVIVYVDDVERMASFYGDVFGLSVSAGDPEHGFVKFDTGACELALHHGGEEGVREDAPKVVFEVDDLDAARQHLAAHDVTLGEERTPAPGVRVVDGRDPEGNKFSIETSSE